MSTTHIDRTVLKGTSIVNFRAAIRSEATRDPYERRLIHFLTWYDKGCDAFVEDGKADPHVLESMLLEFIQTKKALVVQKKMSASTLSGFLKPIRLLLEMNDVSINWKKIKRTILPSRRFALDRAPTDEEIKAIVENSDIRGKDLALLFVSSGIREGAIEGAKVYDFVPIKRDDTLTAAKLTVYPGESEQYIAFASPEAWNACQEYLKFRQMHGEEITEDSPLFCDKFDPIEGIRHRTCHNAHVLKPVLLTGPAIRKYYNYLLHQLGMRVGPERRHEFSV
jgi:hypothetical protein